MPICKQATLACFDSFADVVLRYQLQIILEMNSKRATLGKAISEDSLNCVFINCYEASRDFLRIQ